MDFTLIPIPTTAYSGCPVSKFTEASVKIPQIFLPFKNRSFTHLIFYVCAAHFVDCLCRSDCCTGGYQLTGFHIGFRAQNNTEINTCSMRRTKNFFPSYLYRQSDSLQLLLLHFCSFSRQILCVVVCRICFIKYDYFSVISFIQKAFYNFTV